jgi:DNA-binding HxlR family transcriptional regulator
MACEKQARALDVTRGRKSDCPVHFALEVFGDAWTLLIVRDLMFKEKSSYTDFLRGEEGVATNILADRLARLERDGIIEKSRPTGRSAPRYRLTTKGIDLAPILLEIIRWSAKYDDRTAADPAFVRRLKSDPDGLELQIRSTLYRAGHGRKKDRRTGSERRSGRQEVHR